MLPYKGNKYPKWLKMGTRHYPRLFQLRSHLGIDNPSSEEESDEIDLDSEESAVSIISRKLNRTKWAIDPSKVGVDASAGKDSKLCCLSSSLST